MTEGAFQWPCDRRDAHGQHYPEIGDVGGLPGITHCSGVPAHPATMIGGAYRDY